MSTRAYAILVIAAFTLLAGCSRSQPSQQKAHPTPDRPGKSEVSLPTTPATAPWATGRFEIVAAPRDVAGTFLLDTMTGRVWRLVQKTGLEGEPYVWEHMARLDSNADDYVFQQEHQKPHREYR
ncbi:MAG TPA: hypothetical protein VGL35_05910 [Rhizomicrobium sp.]|jgi:hypothetical protein